MTDQLQKIVQSKRTLRRELAARPIAEKLALLDTMRERESTVKSRLTVQIEKSSNGKRLGG